MINAGTDDWDFPTKAILGKEHLTDNDIRDVELGRARHALAYLKARIGNAAMLTLLEDDLAAMTAQVRGWVEASNGMWQTGSVEMIVPGPSAETFHAWYTNAWANSCEAELRAGHPEHFVSHSHPGVSAEVVENIGATELPWWVLYKQPADGDFPEPWNPAYPVNFGMELLDRNGLRVGFTMHQMRDQEDGMHMLLTTFLPAAASRELVDRHLQHFTIEFRNWTRAAWLESRKEETRG